MYLFLKRQIYSSNQQAVRDTGLAKEGLVRFTHITPTRSWALIYVLCLLSCSCLLRFAATFGCGGSFGVSTPLQVELVADSLEGMERLLGALEKSKSKSKRDDVKLYASLAEVKL